jgi:hypothetical protein
MRIVAWGVAVAIALSAIASSSATAQIATPIPTPRAGLGGTAAKAAVKCSKEISKGAGTFVAQKRAGLKACLDTVVSCIQLKGDDLPACVGKAAATCAKRVGKIATVEAKVQAKIVALCTSPALADGFLSEPGLGFGSPALADSCAALGVPSVSDAAAVATCLVRQHACAVEDMFPVEYPQADYLLALVDRTLHSPFCPSEPPPSPTVTPSATPTATPTPTATSTPGPNLLFTVTNTVAGGNFGDRAATSAICAGGASTQGLTCNATLALLAYSGGDDIAGFPGKHAVPADVPVLAAGSLVQIADTWADLLDGSWDTCLGTNCDPTATGAGLGGGFFLTGANADGSVDAANNCSDWSTTSGTFRVADDTCYGGAGFVCTAGATFDNGICADPLCCNVTQGALLCLCY